MITATATLQSVISVTAQIVSKEVGTCADANVRNSDSSYTNTVASGDTLVLPDITVTDSDGSTSSVPSVQDVTCSPCADATVTLNGVTMETIPSGDTENIQVRQSSGSTLVGSKQGQYWRIDDSEISINGSPVADVKAEDSLDIDVTQDGSPVGSWNGSAWIVPSCPTSPVVEIGIYSDSGFTNPITSADIGDTIYLRAENVSGITPVEYLFALIDSSGTCTTIYNGANDNTSWVVDGTLGDGQLFCFGTEDASSPESWVGQSKDFELAGFEALLDASPNNNLFCVSQVSQRFAFTDPLVRYRRSSDNAEADFSRDDSVTPVRITDDSIASNSSPSSHDGDALSTFISGVDAYTPVLYDQSTSGNDTFNTTLAEQPKVASSGSLILDASRPVIRGNGSQKHYIWTPNTPAPAAFQDMQDEITLIAWVKPSALPSGGVFWFAQNSFFEITASGKVPLSVGFEGNKLKVGFASNSTSTNQGFQSTSTFITNTWYKIGVVVNTTNVNIIIDGALDSTHTITISGTRNIGSANSYGSLFGRGNNVLRAFQGDCIVALLKKEALTPAEVIDLQDNYLI